MKIPDRYYIKHVSLILSSFDISYCFKLSKVGYRHFEKHWQLLQYRWPYTQSFSHKSWPLTIVFYNTFHKNIFQANPIISANQGATVRNIVRCCNLARSDDHIRHNRPLTIGHMLTACLHATMYSNTSSYTFLVWADLLFLSKVLITSGLLTLEKYSSK